MEGSKVEMSTTTVTLQRWRVGTVESKETLQALVVQTF